MAEYIDRDLFLKNVKHNAPFIYSIAAPIALITPPADVAPVVHGRWKCYGDCGVTKCSVCGWSIEEYVGDYNYCPNCGARMDDA